MKDTSKQRACDLMKQVMLIHEPFTSAELVALVVTSPPTTRSWIQAMENEGLLEQCGTTKNNCSHTVPLYKRAGVLK